VSGTPVLGPLSYVLPDIRKGGVTYGGGVANFFCHLGVEYDDIGYMWVKLVEGGPSDLPDSNQKSI